MGKQKITITLDSDIIRKAKIQAIMENRSVSAIINELLKQYLSNSDTPS